MVEQDAYETVNSYLEELQSYYGPKEGGSEIMEGIEERMAELILEKIGVGGAVSLETVNQVIDTLGRPKAIEEESDIDGNGETETGRTETRSEEQPHKEKPHRRLYRDTSHAMLGGVCAGLGEYLNVDTTLFRIGFVVLSLFSAGLNGAIGSHHFGLSVPLIYIILWICMPEAKTIRQRDELRGKKGTVDEISEDIKKGSKEVGDAIAKGAKEFSDGINRFASSNNAKGIGRAIEVVVGIILLILGTALATAIWALFAGHGNLGFAPEFSYLWNQLLENVDGLERFLELPGMNILALAVVGLPVIGMLYSSVALIFNLKNPKYHIGLITFVLWVIACVVMYVLMLSSGVEGMMFWK